jgi:exodeoxyribonuclease III
VKVVTWNVNSVRQRLPRLIAMLARHEPDVACLQETKVTDEAFPSIEVAAAGYEWHSNGQRAANGVATLSREAPTDVGRAFPGDPVPDQARVLSATIGELRVINVYVVNGKTVTDPAYQVKLQWLDAFVDWLDTTADLTRPLLVAGDFNVAPTDLDVYDPELWRDQNLASEPERERIRRLESLGLVDLGRRAAGDVEGPFSFWDYRMGAFHRGWGLRIDLLLGTPPVAERLVSVEVDRQERKPTAGEGKPSDHAPVILTLRD